MSTSLGPGCPKCQCAVGSFFTCRVKTCKNYSPPIIGKGGAATRPAETIITHDVSLYGRWSDPKKRFGRYSNPNALIGETFRTRLHNSISLKYAACWTGDIDFSPTGKKADEVVVTAVRGTILVTYYDLIGGAWTKQKQRDTLS